MRVTVRDLAEAMIADTTPKAKEYFTLNDDQETVYFYYDDDGVQKPSPYALEDIVGSSCAIGGATLKLGIDPDWVYDTLLTIDRDGVPVFPEFDPKEGYGGSQINGSLGIWITQLNDKTDTEKADIGRTILEHADEDTLNAVVFDTERVRDNV